MYGRARRSLTPAYAWHELKKWQISKSDAEMQCRNISTGKYGSMDVWQNFHGQGSAIRIISILKSTHKHQHTVTSYRYLDVCL